MDGYKEYFPAVHLGKCLICCRCISLVVESLFFERIVDFEDVFGVVGEELGIQDDAVFFEFGFCMEFFKFGRYLSSIRQKLLLKHFDKVEPGFPVLHKSIGSTGVS